MRWIFVSAATLLLASCEVGAARTAKDLVAERLLDPRSAQFEDIKVADGIACGRVNAKNRMGGYVGFKRFVVDLKSRAVSIEPDAAGDLREPDEQAKGYAGIIFDLEKWSLCPS